MRWAGLFRDPLLRDPLFLVAFAAYALNRWVLKPHTHSVFIHGYFNDLWLIPAALPQSYGYRHAWDGGSTTAHRLVEKLGIT